MPIRTYNRFTPGVQQDDFLTNGPGFIEQKNMDGLRDGYALHLGPKVNKALITNGAMCAMSARFNSVTPNRSIIAGKNGEIYRLDSTDNTPIYTMTNGANILNIEYLNDNWYLFYKENLTSANIGIAKVSANDVVNGTFASMDETFKGGYNWTQNMPIINIDDSLVFASGFGAIAKMDESGSDTIYSFPDEYAVGLTLQGTTVMVYTRIGSVYMWDGDSVTYSARKSLGFRISKVQSKSGMDYITSEDGQLYVGSGFSIQRVVKPKKSNRMNNNASYDARLSFQADEEDEIQNRTMSPALGDMYLYCNDTVKGCYKHGKLQEGMNTGFHKIFTQNHEGNQIDYIYDFYLIERDFKLYFLYKAGDTYGVDYIDLSSLETATDGYAITEVFSGNTSYDKKIQSLLRATSNTSGNNYINLYYRVNNQEWILVRRVNDTNDIITRDEINAIGDSNEEFKQNIDVQFKIEFHNDDGGVDSPSLHEFVYEYNLI